jgi:hypothetical protein
MKHQRLIPLSAALTGLCLAGILQAAPPPMPTPIEMFDKDGSGTVSEEEFNAGRAERMAKMAESGRPMRYAGQGPQFSDLDADKDGEVTLEEFTEARRAMMERRHAERMARRAAMREAMPPMQQGYPQRGGCMQGGGGQGTGYPGGCMHKQGMGHQGCMHRKGMGHHGMGGKHKPRYSFEDIDLDGDGMINKEEFEKHHASK